MPVAVIRFLPRVNLGDLMRRQVAVAGRHPNGAPTSEWRASHVHYAALAALTKMLEADVSICGSNRDERLTC